MLSVLRVIIACAIYEEMAPKSQNVVLLILLFVSSFLGGGDYYFLTILLFYCTCIGIRYLPY